MNDDISLYGYADVQKLRALAWRNYLLTKCSIFELTIESGTGLQVNDEIVFDPPLDSFFGNANKGVITEIEHINGEQDKIKFKTTKEISNE